MQPLSQKDFLTGFDLLKQDAYDMPPLIYDDIAAKIHLVGEEIRLWKDGQVEKPSWGFFSRLFEDILDRAHLDSYWP